jgi:hypothetical protein
MSTESVTQIEAFKAVTVHTKVKSVLRLLQGESPDKVADDLGVSTGRLLRWKERFIEGGRASLLRRRTDETARAQQRRQKIVQWTVLVIGLMLAIWLITRVFPSLVQGGA